MKPDECSGISIVVPTHGRVELLERLLKSVQRSREAAGVPVEVRIVDSSPAEAGERIKQLCGEHEALYLRGPLSVRQKRNLGVRESLQAWILFVDSDCEISPGLLSAYAAFIQSSPNALTAAAGPTRFGVPETTFTRAVAQSSLLQPFRNPERLGDLLWVPTCNLLVSRRTFEQADGFRENLPFRLGGDDTDFCLRLHEAGGRIAAIPEAICWHTWETWSSPWAVARRSFRWGWMHAILLDEHRVFRRLDVPGLAFYTLACLLLSMAGLALGRPIALLATPLFLLLAVLLHGISVSLGAAHRLHAFTTDLVLAFVECPFGFGKLLRALTRASLGGVWYRLDRDDGGMDRLFPEVVRDLWSNNLALLLTLLLIVLWGGPR